MKMFSTEQISRFHPDKYADQISDALLTAYLREDPGAHCGIETMVKDNTVVLGGEITSHACIDHNAIVRRVAEKLRYPVGQIFDFIGAQSPQINAAVCGDLRGGAGDQGMMFGYATDETPSRLPYAFDLANRVIAAIERDVELNERSPLKGDAKTQVTADLETGRILNVLVSACHEDGLSLDEVKAYVKNLLAGSIEEQAVSRLQINPAGIWTIGGPFGDCGLTGRKIVCDQYGGFCPVGGGAFSGKDPSKVDRSASYMARSIAVDMVNEYGGNCTVQLAYAIGVAEPVSVSVISSTAGDLSDVVRKLYDLTPKGIIDILRLLNIDYEKLSEGCHFRNIFGSAAR